MSAFSEASKIERRALEVLMPYLDTHADGRVVLTNKGVLAKFLQRVVGDAIYNDKQGVMWTVEIKAEEAHTGNLFLETWSNKNLDVRANQAEYGSTTGWMFCCRADLLFYYFLDSDDLYIVNTWKLKRWAFGTRETQGQIYQFREVWQRKYNQPNDTHGRIVPVDVLNQAFGVTNIKLRQFELWRQELAA